MTSTTDFSPAQVSPRSGKPLIVVCGATGLLGGAVVDALIESRKYRILGVCKPQDTAASRELQCEGCEMVETDLAMEEKEDLSKIFDGAMGAFIITDSLDSSMHDHEREIGMRLVEAARKSGVKHVVYTSLPNVSTISKGRYNVPSFSAKAMVEDALMKMQSSEFNRPFESVTIVRPGFYFQNFRRFFIPHKEEDVLVFTMPKTTHPISAFNAADLGPIVLKVFENPSEYSNHRVDVAFEELTPQQFIETFRKVCHCSVELVEVPVKEYPREVHHEWSEEMAQLFAFIDEFGFFGPEKDFSLAKEMNPKWTTFESFLRHSEWVVE